MEMFKRNRRILLITAMVILLSPLSILAYMYMNERAGGLADQRISKVWGLSEPIHIPIANSPERAVQEFRGEFYTPQFIHQEAVDGGMILFTHKKGRENNSNLQMEYTRKNIFGWKWVWGGGYSINESVESKFALHYMSIPKLEQVSTPFPMLFGNIEDSSIKRISVETQENGTVIATEAKLIEVSPGHLIWYVFLPPSAAIPYVIEGFNEEGKLITHEQIKDANDSGSFTLGK